MGDLYGAPTYKAEDLKRLYLGCYQIWVNQGWRHATVLAILDDEALIEYEMPNGSTSLRIVPLLSDLNGAIEMATRNTWRNVSYWRVPRKWLCEMVRTGETWIGSPQQSEDCVPDPAEMYRRAYNRTAAARTERAQAERNLQRAAYDALT